MPTPPLSDDLALEAAEALREHGSIAAAAAALNVPRSTMQNRVRHARNRGFLMTEIRVTETTNADGSLRARSVTSKPLGEAWNVPDDWSVSRVSVLTDAEGREVQRWTRASPEIERAARFLEIAEKRLGHAAPLAPIPAPSQADDDLLTVYPVSDAHLGQLSWGRETGEDYSLDTACRTVTDLASQLIGSSPASGTAVLLFLGDYLHADDDTAQTPTGKHSLDVDSRHVKVLAQAVDLALALVSMAAHRHRHVVVRFLPGNHDPTSAGACAVAVRAAYRDDPRVTVDCSPSLFWFYEWGRVLLSGTHGHTIKQKELPMAIAASVPEMWGRTRFRVAFTGHVHHQSTVEAGGVVCMSFPPLAARDAYAAGRGLYSLRGLRALIFDRNDGPCGEVARYLPAATMEAA